MLKCINYFNGYVRVRISGFIPEKLINLCMAQGIILWDITKDNNNDLYANMRLPDFFCIRPLVLKSKCRVKLISFHGLPFLGKKMRRRKTFVFGSIIFFAFLYVLSSYIWFVDISGLRIIQESRIKEIAYQNGLKPGLPKNKVETKRIEQELLVNIPEIAWVGINFTGTRAVIEVVEKTMPKQADKSPAHIIASKAGIIEEIIVLAGQAAVKKGDTVKKGDLLIKGQEQLILSEANINNSTNNTLPEQTIRAKGLIRARVWYESYGEAALISEISERTGRRAVGVTLKIGGQEYVLKQVSEQAFEFSEIDTVFKKMPGWRNSSFTVESSIRIHHEIAKRMVKISEQEARALAKARALEAVQKVIPEAAQILTRKIEMLNTGENNLVRVKASLEAIEDISESISISP